jgi:hypothetical protein
MVAWAAGGDPNVAAIAATSNVVLPIQLLPKAPGSGSGIDFK